MRCHPSLVKMILVKKARTASAGEDVGERRPFSTLLVEKCGHCGKQCGCSSENELPYDPTVPLLGIYLKEAKTRI